jgi:signal transduction histidine kinase
LILGEEMFISIADTGAGIPLEAQARIFDRFYQADPARKGGERHGAGLGLAIIHEIVQAHGGRITVRSGLGKGTTFDVFLPLNHP